MKNFSKQFSCLSDLKKNLNLEKLDSKKTLIQIFCGLNEKPQIKELQQIIEEKNSALNYIGTTTAGEIFNGKGFENTIVVSILEFEHTVVSYGNIYDKEDYEMGRLIAQKLFHEKTKTLLLFADGLAINGSELLDGVTSVNSTISIAGGLAGDNGHFNKTYVFDKNGIYDKGVVAAALNSDILNVFTDYQLNWQPIGKVMTVTKANKNRLYEIDGINVTELYKKYLGENIGNTLPHSAIEFPIIKVEDNGLEVCRSFNHQFEDGSLLTIGNLEVGDKVRFTFGNINLVLDNTRNNIDKYRSYEPEVIFTYSCAGRKSFFQSQVEKELMPLEEIASTNGFFTYGEIFHSDNKNLLLNISLTILGFSEVNYCNIIKQSKGINKNKKLKNFNTDKHFLALDALTNLSNKVIEELEETKKELKEQAIRDYLTSLYNRRYFDEIAYELLELSKRDGEDLSVIVLDIDKFKTINDTFGHALGDEVIKVLSKFIVTNKRESDVAARLGGEEFAILLPKTNKAQTFIISEKLRKKIEQNIISIGGKEIKFTISIGISQVNIKKDKQISEAVDRADVALYKAKKSGRNRIEVY